MLRIDFNKLRFLVCAAIVSFTLAAGSVFAADQRPVFKTPPPPPIAVYSWTGFYVGGHVGWGSDSVGWVHTHDGETHTGSMDGNAFLGGVQAGFNYQFARNWIIGVEGQNSWTDINGYSAFAHNGEPHTVTSHMNWIATVGPRLGYAGFDRTLVYVKGGTAWAVLDYGHTHTHLTDPVVHAFSGSETRTGWFIGAGLERAFWDRFSAKIEYNFIDLGSKDVMLNSLESAGSSVVFNFADRIHIVKVGVNYHFGAPAPVIAKY
jgi:outer membrane immunogenic protein